MAPLFPSWSLLANLCLLPTVASALLHQKGDDQQELSPSDQPISANDFVSTLRQMKKDDTACLPELDLKIHKYGFAMSQNWLDSYMKPSSQVFMVGDSVMGQLCVLGKPGICCSNNRPCDGTPVFGQHDSWEVLLDKTERYAGKGWQHLVQYKARNKNNTAYNTVYQVAPQVGEGLIESAVGNIHSFVMEEHAPTEDDLMVIGLLGNHFNDHLDLWDQYAQLLMTKIVNNFPGRVVLVGYSPQHFDGSGHYVVGQSKEKSCGPQPSPGEENPPMGSYRNAVWVYNIWKYMSNKKARFVDVYNMLSPMWSCHRAVGDCTHWTDPVISVKVQLIMNVLESLQGS